MRLWWLSLLLAACGGGGSGTPPDSAPFVVPSVDLATSYEPSGSGSAIYRYIGGGTGTYSWQPGRIRWGESVEHHGVRHCGGEDWYWLEGYSPVGSLEALPSSVLPRWPVETVRAEWINVDAGTLEDVTGLCRSSALLQANGQPYLPNLLPSSGHFRIRVWGWVWTVSARERRWYWQADLTFGLSVFNPCWQGSGSSTRRAFEMREVWWDDNGLVRGTLPHLPWVGEFPADPGVAAYTWTATYGKDAGPLWTFNDMALGVNGCLQSVK